MRQPGAKSALERWVAAQATRTQQVEALARAYEQMLLRVGRVESAVHSREWINNARVHLFHTELDEMRSCGWRVYSADADEKHSFILADEPVIKTPPTWATGTMYLVPLSPRVLIAGGSDEGHRALSDPDRNILPLGFNGLAMSFAHRFVDSASLLELESVASMFSRTADPEHQAWMRQAQEPTFALEAVLRDATDDEVAKLLRRR